MEYWEVLKLSHSFLTIDIFKDFREVNMLDLEIEEGNSFHLIVALSSRDVSDNLHVDLSINTVELLSFGIVVCTFAHV
jgi:hypothetical protein